LRAPFTTSGEFRLEYLEVQGARVHVNRDPIAVLDERERSADGRLRGDLRLDISKGERENLLRLLRCQPLEMSGAKGA
jgi:hypothetical protein